MIKLYTKDNWWYVYDTNSFPCNIDEAQELFSKWEIISNRIWFSTDWLKDYFILITKYRVLRRFELEQRDWVKLLLEAQKKKDKEVAILILIYWGVLWTPSIPEETVSALELFEEGLDIQKETYKRIEAHKDKVKLHYRKYGSLFEKFINYIK